MMRKFSKKSQNPQLNQKKIKNLFVAKIKTKGSSRIYGACLFSRSGGAA